MLLYRGVTWVVGFIGISRFWDIFLSCDVVYISFWGMTGRPCGVV